MFNPVGNPGHQKDPECELGLEKGRLFGTDTPDSDPGTPAQPGAPPMRAGRGGQPEPVFLPDLCPSMDLRVDEHSLYLT